MNKDFLIGVKSAIPTCLGVIPVGISFGLLGVQAGLSQFETIAMSVMVMAGSSQLMAVNMITQGASMVAIIISTFFINLRHIIMSSAVMQRLKNISLSKKLLVSFALCDESFAIYSLSENEKSYHFLLGTNTALYISFIISTILGSILTSFLPKIVIDSFGIAVYAAFLGLLIPGIKGDSKLIALVIITGLLNFILQLFIPSSWSVILSMVIGAFIGIYIVDDKLVLDE